MYPKIFMIFFTSCFFFYKFGLPVLADGDYSMKNVQDWFSYATSVVAWAILDLVPFVRDTIRIAALMVVTANYRELCVRLLWFLVTLPFVLWGRLVRSIYDAFQCPRQETFLFFWSYPQSYYCAWYNAHYGRWRALSSLDTYILLACSCTCIVLGLGFTLRYLYDTRAKRVIEYLAGFFSCIIYGSPYKHHRDYKTYREVFQNTPIPEGKHQGSHSHAQAASFRATASAFMRAVIVALVHVPWICQMSSHEKRMGYQGSRTPFWIKDLAGAPCTDPMLDNSSIMMVDVDYYVDMPRWLASNFAPHVLYTFQPKTAGIVANEYAYSFDDDLVTYQVTGGGKYTHFVWNYQQDSISTTHYFFGCFPIARASYLVERRAGGCEHEVVMLIPLRSWGIWNAWISHLFVPEVPLKTFALKVGNHNRLRIHDASGINVSTAHVGATSSITIPHDIDEEILTVSRITKLDIAYPTVAQILGSHQMESLTGAKTLTEFARSKLDGGDNRACVPLIQHYQYTGPQYDPDAKSTLVAFMKPLALPAFAPKLCYENEDKMAKGRVVSVQNDEIPLTMLLDSLLTEFVEVFIPDDVAHTFHPFDHDSVIDRQNRPSQRRIIAASEFDCTSNNSALQGFMKKEPKPDAGHPRPIVIYEGDTKVSYSQYMYALSHYLKTQDWYAFGHTPLHVSEILVGMAANSLSAASSDGSRWDGRVSNILRDLESRIITRFFATVHHDQAHRLHKKQYMRKVRTTMGVQYDLKFSRGSGSPETSVFNSIENKFIAFVAHRCHETAEYDAPGPMSAYLAPGLYGGDDGVTFNVSVRDLVEAAKLVGQSYASELHNRGEPIKFLSRTYGPRIWYGDPSSACDLDRSMRNFNTTTNLVQHVTPVMKLIEKARAYWLTDANTPFIGDFVSAVMESADALGLDEIDDHSLDPMRSWNSRIPKDLQYPNELEPSDLSWVNAPPGFNADEFLTWLHGIYDSNRSHENKLKAYLDPPYCDIRPLPVTAPEEAVVGDSLHPKADKPLPPLLVLKPLSECSPAAAFAVPAVPFAAFEKAAPAAPFVFTGKQPKPAKSKLVPCPACSLNGKVPKHDASHCWAGKTSQEIAALKAARAESTTCSKCSTALGKPANHSTQNCWVGKTPEDIRKLKEAAKKKKK